MQANPLISVIVPIYNVESYLKKCVDSILNQTYTNLEIIMVDDGSPDGCPAICDEYAVKDGRIRVIHKENGGVSSARNAGMAAAAGDYIGFTDSDDWIEPDMFERLVGNALKYKTDISVCGTFVGPEQQAEICSKDSTGQMTGRQAQMYLLSSHPLMPSLCNKIYRRELLPVLKNDVGLAFTEDMHANYRAFGASTAIVIDDTPGYHCVPRDGSAVYAGVNQGHLDAIGKAEEMLEAVQGDQELERLWRRRCTALRLTVLNRIIKAGQLTEHFGPIRRSLLQLKWEIFTGGLYSPREKVQTLVLWLCPGLYAWVVRRKTQNIDT